MDIWLLNTINNSYIILIGKKLKYISKYDYFNNNGSANRKPCLLFDKDRFGLLDNLLIFSSLGQYLKEIEEIQSVKYDQ